MQRRAREVLIVGTLFSMAVSLSATGSDAAEAYKLKMPPGLQEDAAYIPPDNPLTVDKINLGKQLYFDKRLSADGAIACVTCHAPDKGFSDAVPPRQGSKDRSAAAMPPSRSIASSARNSSGMAGLLHWKIRRWARFRTRSRWATLWREWWRLWIS